MKIHTLPLNLPGLRGILLCVLISQLASADLCAAAELPRFLPNDGNNIYAATGLLRRWPPGGPRELWRSEIGNGKSAIAESAGRLYTLTQIDKQQYAICLEAATGRTLWKQLLLPKDNHHVVIGPVDGPILDGNRLYVFPYDCENGEGFSQCLEMTVVGDTLVPRLVYQDKRLQCNMFHTPSIYNGAVFGFGKGTEHDALQCTALEDGRLLWQQESDDWKTDRQLTIADGLIFAITRNDALVLLEASREGYQELGRIAPGIPLGMPQQPMIVGNRLYLRGNTTLICYQIGGG